MKALPDIEPATRRGAVRFFAALDHAVRRVPPLRAFLLWPIFTRPGYWFATACIFVYGTVLPGRFRTKNGMHYFAGMPTWSFGRGGTTIGAIYLTRDNDSDDVIAHEAAAEGRGAAAGYGDGP